MIPKLKYFKFLLKSINHHGVHSPFLYRYLTQCVYAKPKRHAGKTMDILLKSIPYFKVNSVYLPNNDSLVWPLLEKKFQGLEYQKPPYDLIYLQASGSSAFTPIKNSQFHNDTICIIDHIHHTRGATARWEEVRSLPKARLTIDCFHCGLVFFRKEQVAEHFTIRI